MTGVPLVAGDRLLLERVLRETGVERVPSRPGVADYMLVVARALVERLGRVLEPLGDLLRPHSSTLVLATKVFVLVVLGMLLFVLIRWILRRRALPRQAPKSAADASAIAPSGREDLALEFEMWASEMDLHLEAGDVRGALNALWWWLARSLCGSDADPSWTSRELLDRARRPDLRPFAAVFDRLAYGPEAPRVPEVRELVSRLRIVLA
jgi:hypothetical protein